MENTQNYQDKAMAAFRCKTYVLHQYTIIFKVPWKTLYKLINWKHRKLKGHSTKLRKSQHCNASAYFETLHTVHLLLLVYLRSRDTLNLLNNLR